MVEAAGEAYLGYLLAGIYKQVSGIFQAELIKICHRLFADYAAETAEAFAFADISSSCDVLNGDIAAVIFMDKGEHFLYAFFAGAYRKGLGFNVIFADIKGKGVPYLADDISDFQLIAKLMLFGSRVKLSDKGEDILFPGRRAGKFKPLDRRVGNNRLDISFGDKVRAAVTDEFGHKDDSSHKRSRLRGSRGFHVHDIGIDKKTFPLADLQYHVINMAADFSGENESKFQFRVPVPVDDIVNVPAEIVHINFDREFRSAVDSVFTIKLFMGAGQ